MLSPSDSRAQRLEEVSGRTSKRPGREDPGSRNVAAHSVWAAGGLARGPQRLPPAAGGAARSDAPGGQTLTPVCAGKEHLAGPTFLLSPNPRLLAFLPAPSYSSCRGVPGGSSCGRRAQGGVRAEERGLQSLAESELPGGGGGAGRTLRLHGGTPAPLLCPVVSLRASHGCPLDL